MSDSFYELKKVDYQPSHKHFEYDEVWVGLKFKFTPPPNFVIGIRWTQYGRNLSRDWSFCKDNEIGDEDDRKYKQNCWNPEERKSTLYFKVAKFALNSAPRDQYMHASLGDKRTIEFAIYCRDIVTNQINWLTEFNNNYVISINDGDEHTYISKHNYY